MFPTPLCLNHVVVFSQALWLSWLVTSLIKNGFVTLCIVVVLKLGKLFQHSDFFLLCVFFLLFQLVCLMFTFAMSTIFSKARSGGVVGMLVWIALSTPAYGLTSASVSRGAQLASCLLAPIAFNFGASLLNLSEEGFAGINWNTLGDRVAHSSIHLSLGTIMGMLVLDIVLYAALTWYLSKVVPNEFGTTLRPLFCLSRSYWRRCCGSSTRGDSSRERHHLLRDFTAGEDVVATEPVPADMASRLRVELRGLTKVFDTKDGPKTAVKNLSLDLYESQITAVLAHNGGGGPAAWAVLAALHVLALSLRSQPCGVCVRVCRQDHHGLHADGPVPAHLWRCECVRLFDRRRYAGCATEDRRVSAGGLKLCVLRASTCRAHKLRALA